MILFVHTNKKRVALKMENSIIQTIIKRRSTRAFKEEQLKKEEIDLIINAGLYAPSAHNQQSWHFTVIKNRNLLTKISDAAKEEAEKSSDELIKKIASNKKYDIFYGAPSIIIVSGNKESLLPEIDCAAATQNILIAAESINVGTCWNGLIKFLFNSKNAELYKTEFGIPENYEPYYAIAIGYKKIETINAPERKENKVNYIF